MKIITTDDKTIRIALLNAVTIGMTSAQLIFTDKETYTQEVINEKIDKLIENLK